MRNNTQELIRYLIYLKANLAALICFHFSNLEKEKNLNQIKVKIKSDRDFRIYFKSLTG